MEDKRKLAPEEGPEGVDRWTSSGIGVTLVPPEKVKEMEEKADNIDEIEEIDAE